SLEHIKMSSKGEAVFSTFPSPIYSLRFGCRSDERILADHDAFVRQEPEVDLAGCDPFRKVRVPGVRRRQESVHRYPSNGVSEPHAVAAFVRRISVGSDRNAFKGLA